MTWVLLLVALWIVVAAALVANIDDSRRRGYEDTWAFHRRKGRYVVLLLGAAGTAVVLAGATA